MLSEIFEKVSSWEVLNNGLELAGYDFGWLLYNKESKEFARIGWKGGEVASIQISTEI